MCLIQFKPNTNSKKFHQISIGSYLQQHRLGTAYLQKLHVLIKLIFLEKPVKTGDLFFHCTLSLQELFVTCGSVNVD